MGVFSEMRQEFIAAYQAGRQGPAAEEELRQKRQDKREVERIARLWIEARAKSPADQDAAREEIVNYVLRREPPSPQACDPVVAQGEPMTLRRWLGTAKEWREFFVLFTLFPLVLLVILIRRPHGKLGTWLQARYRVTHEE